MILEAFYNKHISRGRCVVEDAFRILKIYLDNNCFKKNPSILFTQCTCHCMFYDFILDGRGCRCGCLDVSIGARKLAYHQGATRKWYSTMNVRIL